MSEGNCARKEEEKKGNSQPIPKLTPIKRKYKSLDISPKSENDLRRKRLKVMEIREEAEEEERMESGIKKVEEMLKKSNLKNIKVEERKKEEILGESSPRRDPSSRFSTPRRITRNSIAPIPKTPKSAQKHIKNKLPKSYKKEWKMFQERLKENGALGEIVEVKNPIRMYMDGDKRIFEVESFKINPMNRHLKFRIQKQGSSPIPEEEWEIVEFPSESRILGKCREILKIKCIMGLGDDIQIKIETKMYWNYADRKSMNTTTTTASWGDCGTALSPLPEIVEYTPGIAKEELIYVPQRRLPNNTLEDTRPLISWQLDVSDFIESAIHIRKVIFAKTINICKENEKLNYFMKYRCLSLKYDLQTGVLDKYHPEKALDRGSKDFMNTLPHTYEINSKSRLLGAALEVGDNLAREYVEENNQYNSEINSDVNSHKYSEIKSEETPSKEVMNKIDETIIQNMVFSESREYSKRTSQEHINLEVGIGSRIICVSGSSCRLSRPFQPEGDAAPIQPKKLGFSDEVDGLRGRSKKKRTHKGSKKRSKSKGKNRDIEIVEDLEGDIVGMDLIRPIIPSEKPMRKRSKRKDRTERERHHKHKHKKKRSHGESHKHKSNRSPSLSDIVIVPDHSEEEVEVSLNEGSEDKSEGELPPPRPKYKKYWNLLMEPRASARLMQKKVKKEKGEEGEEGEKVSRSRSKLSRRRESKYTRNVDPNTQNKRLIENKEPIHSDIIRVRGRKQTSKSKSKSKSKCKCKCKSKSKSKCKCKWRTKSKSKSKYKGNESTMSPMVMEVKTHRMRSNRKEEHKRKLHRSKSKGKEKKWRSKSKDKEIIEYSEEIVSRCTSHRSRSMSRSQSRSKSQSQSRSRSKSRSRSRSRSTAKSRSPSIPHPEPLGNITMAVPMEDYSLSLPSTHTNHTTYSHPIITTPITPSPHATAALSSPHGSHSKFDTESVEDNAIDQASGFISTHNSFSSSRRLSYSSNLSVQKLENDILNLQQEFNKGLMWDWELSEEDREISMGELEKRGEIDRPGEIDKPGEIEIEKRRESYPRRNNNSNINLTPPPPSTYTTKYKQLEKRRVDVSLMREDDMNLYDQALDQLELKTIPERLPCRDKEHNLVYNHIKQGIDQRGRTDTMYISGMPGTGKTATVLEVIRELTAQETLGNINHFTFIHINGMAIENPFMVYTILYKNITGRTTTPGNACKFLDEYFKNGERAGKTRRIPILQPGIVRVLLVDELDSLVTKKQNIIYNIFDWPSYTFSNLVVVGIANTMNLPETLLPKISSRIGGSRLIYEPYNKKEISTILNDRLGGLKSSLGLFESDALRYVSAKLSAMSGDMRRCLQVSRRACEMAQLQYISQATTATCTANRTTETGMQQLIKVGLPHVMKSANELYNSKNSKVIKDLSIYAQIILLGVAILRTCSKRENVEIKMCYDRFIADLSKYELHLSSMDAVRSDILPLARISMHQFEYILYSLRNFGLISVHKHITMDPNRRMVSVLIFNDEIFAGLEHNSNLQLQLEELKNAL